MYLSNNKEKKFESLVFYNLKGFLIVERYILYESIKGPQDAYKRKQGESRVDKSLCKTSSIMLFSRLPAL